MSDQTPDREADPHIAILSDNNSFTVTLMVKFVEQHLPLKCEVLKTNHSFGDDTQLVLIDCQQHPLEKLNTILRHVSHCSDSAKSALLNAEHKSDCENLIDWPSVYGIFYLDTSEDQLVRGIQQILDGDYWVPRRLLHQFFNKHRQSPGRPAAGSAPAISLTNREKEILRMIKEGMSNLEVSDSLALSEHTVKSHLYNIYKKIGVRNRMEAGNWAREQHDLDTL